MIKVCSPQLGISPNSSLGGEIYDYQTLKGFSKSNIKVFVILPKEKHYDRSLKNFEVTYIPIKHVIPPWIFSFLILPSLINLYQKEKFDILRIHSPRFLGVAAFIFHSLYPDVPILTSGVTVDDSGPYFQTEKWVYQKSAAIIVQSQYMKKYLLKKYSIRNDQKINVTYGGQIDSIKKWQKKPAKSNLVDQDDKVLLFMGVLIKRKNPEFLLEIFAEIVKLIPNCKIVFIGTGPERAKIVDFCHKYYLDQKIILVYSDFGEEKAYWFSRMDIFLFPSLDEGFGLVVTEAMSFKKVVITSKKAAFPEIINSGVDGFCLSLNKKLWIKTIIKILKNNKLRQIMGKKAEEKVRTNFSWQRTYKLNAAVVRNML